MTQFNSILDDPYSPQPPIIPRSNASRFSWPPDPKLDWVYISFSPIQLADQCYIQLGRIINPTEVAELFYYANYSIAPAYIRYREKWFLEINDILFNKSYLSINSLFTLSFISFYKYYLFFFLQFLIIIIFFYYFFL